MSVMPVIMCERVYRIGPESSIGSGGSSVNITPFFEPACLWMSGLSLCAERRIAADRLTDGALVEKWCFRWALSQGRRVRI